MIVNHSLPPDMIMGIIPVCMDGVGYMFSSARIPGVEVDHLEINSAATHIVAMS